MTDIMTLPMYMLDPNEQECELLAHRARTVQLTPIMMSPPLMRDITGGDCWLRTATSMTVEKERRSWCQSRCFMRYTQPFHKQNCA